jgi:predicted nucleic-acid-binding Zn-ribbon protein
MMREINTKLAINKNVQHILSCQICRSPIHQFEYDLVAITSNPESRFLQVTCKSCGHTNFFDAEILGIASK